MATNYYTPLGTYKQTSEELQIQQWLREGKTLVDHPRTGPPFAGGFAAKQLGEAEAHDMNLSGAVRRLFVRERQEGWIAAGQAENVTQQGLLDWLLTPVTYITTRPLVGQKAAEKAAEATGNVGVLGLGPSHTKTTRNPRTGHLESKNQPGGAETASNAVGNAAKIPVEWTVALGKLLGNLLSGAFWARIFKITGGALVLLLALWLLFSATAPGAAGQIKARVL